RARRRQRGTAAGGASRRSWAGAEAPFHIRYIQINVTDEFMKSTRDFDEGNWRTSGLEQFLQRGGRGEAGGANGKLGWGWMARPVARKEGGHSCPRSLAS